VKNVQRPRVGVQRVWFAGSLNSRIASKVPMLEDPRRRIQVSHGDNSCRLGIKAVGFKVRSIFLDYSNAFSCVSSPRCCLRHSSVTCQYRHGHVGSCRSFKQRGRAALLFLELTAWGASGIPTTLGVAQCVVIGVVTGRCRRFHCGGCRRAKCGNMLAPGGKRRAFQLEFA
jgi:hypothetical protein